MPFQPPTDLPPSRPVSRPAAPAPSVAKPTPGPKIRRFAFLAIVVLAFLAGGLAPARADAPSDVVRYLERISDSLRELAHRETRCVCECKQ